MTHSALLLNLHCAQVREGRLCDALHANKMFFLETQAGLRISEESSPRQEESLSCETGDESQAAGALERCGGTGLDEGTRRGTEQAEPVDGGGDVFRSAREAREQLKSQTGVLGECEATIRSLDRKLVDVREQIQNAQQKIDGLKSGLEPIDAWKAFYFADGLGL
jgi:hypothetical protein